MCKGNEKTRKGHINAVREINNVEMDIKRKIKEYK